MRLIHLAEFAAECRVSPQSVRKAAERYSFSITKGMVDADCQGAIAYRTHATTQRHVAWHDKSARKRKLEAKAAARTVDAPAPSRLAAVATIQPVAPFAEQRDDEPREYLTHLEAIVLVNDVAAFMASCVETDVMSVSIVPGHKTPDMEPEHMAYVRRIIKAVRSERTNTKAEKKVIDILRAITKKTLADMRELNVFFRHYCMELEDRFNFACDFEPDEWDAIETLSDDPAPDPDTVEPAEKRGGVKHMPLTPFRWIDRGTLDIRRKDGLHLRTVYPPDPRNPEACCVRDPKELEALGAENIERYLREGQAERISQPTTADGFLGRSVHEALKTGGTR